MSISSIKKILLAGTALVAVTAFGAQAQAATIADAGTTGIWASAGTHDGLGTNIGDATSGDTLTYTTGVITVTNTGGTVTDSVADGLNTFTLGPVSTTGGVAGGAFTVSTGSANDLTVNITSVGLAASGSQAAFTVNNAGGTANANATNITTSFATTGGLVVQNADASTTTKAVTLTVGTTTAVGLTTAVTAGAGAGASANIVNTGAATYTGATTLTAGAGAGANATITLNGAGVNAFSGGLTLNDGAAGLSELTVSGILAQTVNGAITTGTGGQGTIISNNNVALVTFGGAVGGTQLKAINLEGTGGTTFSSTANAATVTTTNATGTDTFTGALMATTLNVNAAGPVALNAGGANTITTTNFGADGTVTLGTTAGTITGAVTTSNTNTGTLTLAAGTQSVGGLVGTSTKLLKAVNAGATGGASSFTSLVDATTLNVLGTGTVNLNAAAGINLIGTTAFGTSGGTLSVADGGSLTGNVTTAADTSTLALAGSSTITGNVGAGASGAATSLLSITAGQAGKTDIFNGNVNANGLVLEGAAGIVEIGSGDNLTAAVTGATTSTLSFLGGTQAVTGTITAISAILDVNTASGNGTTTFANAVSVASVNTAATDGATFSSTLTTTGALTNAGTATFNAGTSAIGGALVNSGTLAVGYDSGAALASQPVVGVNSTTATNGAYSFGVTTHSGAMVTGKIVDTGSLSLSNTASTIAVNVDPAAGFITNNSVSLIASGSSVTKSFNGTTDATLHAVTSSNSALYSFDYVNGAYATGTIGTNIATAVAAAAGTAADDIFLVAQQNALSTLGSAVTTNDSSVYTALNTIANNGGAALTAFQGALAAAPTAAAVHNLLQSVTPTVDGGAQSAVLDVGAQTQDIANTRLAALRDGDPTSGVAAGATSNGVSMWFEGYGQHANQDTMDSVNGYSANTWGGAVGADSSALFDKAILGIALNYGHSTVDSADINTTSTDIGNYGLNLYGTYDLGDSMFVNGQAGYAYNTIDSDRHNVGGVAGTTAAGSTDSDQWSARSDIGRDYPLGGATLTPDLSAAYTYLKTAGYSETGAGVMDNIVGSESMSVLDFGIGGTAAWKIKDADDDTFKPSVHAGYAYDAIGDRVQTNSAFAGDPGVTFETQGASPARSIYDLGAKLVFTTQANWDLSANYDFQAKQSYTSNTGEVRVTAHF